jgi:hypothetical protein
LQLKIDAMGNTPSRSRECQSCGRILHQFKRCSGCGGIFCKAHSSRQSHGCPTLDKAPRVGKPKVPLLQRIGIIAAVMVILSLAILLLPLMTTPKSLAWLKEEGYRGAFLG